MVGWSWATAWRRRKKSIRSAQNSNHTREAYELLLPLVNRFPNNVGLPHNLAKYSCRLGNLDEARRWLARLFGMTKDPGIREALLQEPDFKLLWDEIGQQG